MKGTGVLVAVAAFVFTLPQGAMGQDKSGKTGTRYEFIEIERVEMLGI